MIFNKTGRLMRRHFKYKNLKLETVREYKYLGFILTPSGEVATGLTDLKDRGVRAAASIRMKLGDSFRKEFNTTLKLFKSLVMPILLYMADFWGCLKMPKNNPIEIMQNKFLKQLLGVQTQTTNIGVLLETGEIPLSCHAKKICIKNWCRITRNKCNKIVMDSFTNSITNKLSWPLRIREEFSVVGLLDTFLAAGSTAHAEVTFFQRTIDIFHQSGFAQIRDPNSILFKTEIGTEKYLTEISNQHDRTNLTKIRLSNHTLMIEKGRHQKIDKSLRFCPFCKNCIEDELHFVMVCPVYKHQRNLLFKGIRGLYPDFERKNISDQFKRILTDIKNCKNCRKILIQMFCN